MKTILIFLVRVYQVAFSPVLHALCGPLAGCRFTPTCSQYFIDAVRVHGRSRAGGSALAASADASPGAGMAMIRSQAGTFSKNRIPSLHIVITGVR